MTRIPRRFEERPVTEREWLLTNTWCGHCGKADLGMVAPTEYEEGEDVFVEGRCRVCGTSIRSEVETRHLGPDG